MGAARLSFVALACLTLISAAGCLGKNPRPEVPQGAQLVGGGKATILPYVATEPGVAYIVDAKTGKVIFRVAMEIRDQLVFHPAKDRVFFNGTMVRQGGLDVKRDYQLFFVKG